MRTFEGAPGLTLGMAGMVGLYTLLAIGTGAGAMVSVRVNEARGTWVPTMLEYITPTTVSIAWLLCIGSVLAIPIAAYPKNRFALTWGFHCVAIAFWLFLMLGSFCGIIFRGISALT